MRIYTRRGDDGTTGLLYGGRVEKDSPLIATNGAVDEAQAALGVVRAEVAAGSEMDVLLVRLERDLYVAMAELATAAPNRHKLTPGTTLVTAEMVAGLEADIDRLTARFPPLTDFVIPGHDRVSALLDVARTAVRRAERLVVGVSLAVEADGAGRRAGTSSGGTSSGGTSSGGTSSDVEVGRGSLGGSQVPAYLNRLSDLVWTMARWQEQGDSLISRDAPRSEGD